MDLIITKRTKERERNDSEEQLPQLLDSPLPTPRRSCASVDGSRRPRCRRDASPMRTHVPFSWESSPGVPKKQGACRDIVQRRKEQDTMMMPPPPRPPPGRLPLLPSYPARNPYYYGNTSGEASTDDDDDDRSFSDALDRVSSPERTGSFDRVTSRRFEDIFIGRAESFAGKDRPRRAPADAAIVSDISSSGRPPKHWSRRRGHETDRPAPRQSSDDPVHAMQLVQRIKMEAQAEQAMTPRACGLMVFFPWAAKPAVCGFRSPAPAAKHVTKIRAGVDAPSPSSHSRRLTTTLRDAIREENETGGGGDDVPKPRGEKRGREEGHSRRWGVSSLLDTSKKYCTDARKALSKLSIGLGADGGGSPRVSGRQGGFSTMPATPSKLTLLKTNIS